MSAIPQLGITQQILEAMAGANNAKAQQQQNAVAQTNAQTAQQEAAVAAQRLQTETPGITAQGKLFQQQLDTHAAILRGFDVDHPDSQAPLSAAHVYDVAGQHAVVHPDTLNVSNPLQQTLSAPNAPGYFPSTQSGPSDNQQPLDLYQRHAVAIGQSIGGWSPSEAQDVELAHQRLTMNPTPEGLNTYQKELGDIVHRRDNVDYQKQLEFERNGLSEYDAKRAVLTDNKIADGLNAFASDPAKISGPNASSALLQLQSWSKQKNLSPQTQQQIAQLLPVAQQAAAQASKSEFDTWRQAYIQEHGKNPSAKEVQDFKNSGAQIILDGRLNSSTKNYLNLDSNEMEALTPAEFAAKPQGTYVVYDSAVQKANGAHGLLNGIRDTVSNLQTQLADPQFDARLDKGTGALLSTALRASDETTYKTAVGKIAMEQLNPAQQDYVNQLLQLHERAMSLRALQSAGAGSDQSREAIFRTLPGLVDTKESAQKKLNSLSQELTNVERSYPKIGRSNVSAGDSARSASGPVGVAAPQGASDEVYVGGKLAGHVVNGQYVPLAGGK